MNKDNISILLVSDDSKIISLIENSITSKTHKDLSFSVSKNTHENISKVLTHEYIDLVVFDVDGMDINTCKSSKIILDKEISILFLIDQNNLSDLMNSKVNFSLMDYLIKPIQDDVIRHKINIYLQNILQKKASAYLLHAYDESVIASETDLKGIITYVSQAFCDISEYTKEELIGKAHNIVRHPDIPASVYKEIWKTIQSAKQWHGEIKNLKKNGGFYWVQVTISPEFNYNGKVIGYNSIRQDISCQKYIEQISLIDYLTQVYNKKYYDEILETEIYSAKRYQYNLSLLMIDIDLFKDVNDTYGHLVGDKVLKTFANVLRENTRKSDIVSRIGGEEFTIIVSNDSTESVYGFANKIRKAIENNSFETVGKITVSIGMSSLQKGDTSQTLFKRVDEAMYKAKHNGRNCVVKI